jgi:hypothetical protein
VVLDTVCTVAGKTVIDGRSDRHDHLARQARSRQVGLADAEPGAAGIVDAVMAGRHAVRAFLPTPVRAPASKPSSPWRAGRLPAPTSSPGVCTC